VCAVGVLSLLNETTEYPSLPFKNKNMTHHRWAMSRGAGAQIVSCATS
jgi:hypothetical protein